MECLEEECSVEEIMIYKNSIHLIDWRVRYFMISFLVFYIVFFYFVI